MSRTGKSLLASAGVVIVACSVFPEAAPRVHGVGADGGGGRGPVEASVGTGGVASDSASPGGSGATDGGPATGGSASAGGSAGSGGSPTDAGHGATGGGTTRLDAGAGGTGTVIDAGPSRLTYVATVADCLESTGSAPSPDSCRTYASTNDGPNELWVSPKKGAQRVFTGYLRFDLGGTLARRTVTSASLEITVTSYPNAAGNAPDVWQVSAFDRAQLFIAAPAPVGVAAMATSPGLLANGATATYSLPTTLVAANTAVFLGLVPAGADGSGFWNRDGTSPPRLVVEYR